MSRTRPVAVRIQATSPAWTGAPAFTWGLSPTNRATSASPRRRPNGTSHRGFIPSSLWPPGQRAEPRRGACLGRTRRAGRLRGGGRRGGLDPLRVLQEIAHQAVRRLGVLVDDGGRQLVDVVVLAVQDDVVDQRDAATGVVLPVADAA